jgi:hypothetical protein
MRLLGWIAGSLTLLPLSAQSTTPLAVRNVILQQDESYVEFDVTNQASKPAHAWTMAIRAKVSGAQAPAEFHLTSETCSRDATGPLRASETRHCAISLRQPAAAPTLDAEPRVTAVLFEDGSTEGDATLLDRQSAERAMRLKARQYWMDLLQQVCATAATPARQLQRFAGMVKTPGASLPAGLASEAGFAREKQWMEQQVSNALQQSETHNVDDATILRGLGADLERRLKLAKDAAALFPPRT